MPQKPRLTSLCASLSTLALVLGCARGSDAPKPPGPLVDVGGWRLHVNCTGSARKGLPTVILEAGSGDFSFDWLLVQSAVEDFVRVCSYDRAGRAWSDLGPRPRTMSQSVYELHAALDRGGIAPPYVMVGHSSGALLVREFAGAHPGDVAGVVFVDGTNEDIRLNIRGELRRVRDDATGKTPPPIQTRLADDQRTLSAEERSTAEMMAGFSGAPAILPPFDRLPAHARKWRLWALAQPTHHVADDDPFWPDELQAMYQSRRDKPATLGALPLIVISRDLARAEEIEAGEGLAAERRALQDDLAALSTRGRLVVATGSGHHVQLERPEIVIDAIRTILDEIASAQDAT